jgi:ribosomal protein L21
LSERDTKILNSKRFKLDFLTNAEVVDSMELERDPDTFIYKVVTESKLQRKAHKDEANLEKMDKVLKRNGKINKTIFMKSCRELSIGKDLFERLSVLGEKNLGWKVSKVKNQVFYEPNEK